jgi:hypothetical protein
MSIAVEQFEHVTRLTLDRQDAANAISIEMALGIAAWSRAWTGRCRRARSSARRWPDLALPDLPPGRHAEACSPCR